MNYPMDPDPTWTLLWSLTTFFQSLATFFEDFHNPSMFKFKILTKKTQDCSIELFYEISLTLWENLDPEPEPGPLSEFQMGICN
jgi:hypothetical protein